MEKSTGRQQLAGFASKFVLRMWKVICCTGTTGSRPRSISIHLPEWRDNSTLSTPNQRQWVGNGVLAQYWWRIGPLWISSNLAKPKTSLFQQNGTPWKRRMGWCGFNKQYQIYALWRISWRNDVLSPSKQTQWQVQDWESGEACISMGQPDEVEPKQTTGLSTPSFREANNKPLTKGLYRVVTRYDKHSPYEDRITHRTLYQVSKEFRIQWVSMTLIGSRQHNNALNTSSP